MSKESKNTNSKEKKKRSKRETYSIDPETIKDKFKDKEDNIKEEYKTRCNFTLQFNDLLLEKNIDQNKFASDVHISVGAISNYRAGESEPNITNLVKIANKLKVNINYILGISDCPNYNYEYVSKKTGLSQKAIEQLYKFQHNYYPYDDVDVDITEDRKASNFYKEHLTLINSILEDSGGLFFLFDSINKYKIKVKELEEMKKQNKDEIYIEQKQEEIDLYEYRIIKNVLYFTDVNKKKGADKN